MKVRITWHSASPPPRLWFTGEWVAGDGIAHGHFNNWQAAALTIILLVDGFSAQVSGVALDDTYTGRYTIRDDCMWIDIP